MFASISSLGPLSEFRVRPPARCSHDGQCSARLHAVPLGACPALRTLLGFLLAVVLAPNTAAQGPMPEEGATLFPHGAFLSYNSILTTNRRAAGAAADFPTRLQPTWVHEMPLAASWSPRRDLQLTATVPFVQKRLELASGRFSAAGLGDVMIGVKYRFLRRDSKRGTTQASFEFAPKLPTGSSTRQDSRGSRLAPMLQPGSGSLDWELALTSTYTGLFGFRRLVADTSVTRLLRTENRRGIDLGDSTEARLWIHFRPLQTKMVGGEWFIGPDFQFKHTQELRSQGIAQPESGSDIFTAGLTTYISPRGGLVFWASALFPIAQDWNGAPYEQRGCFSFGVTKQFTIGR